MVLTILLQCSGSEKNILVLPHMTLNSALFQFVEPHASVYLGGFLKHPQSTQDQKCRKVLKITKKVSVLTTFILYSISLK